MRKLLLSLLLILSTLACYARSYNDRIINAMNTGDWFALDSIHKTAPKDSVMPFLEVFSRCLIGNRLNRPDISVPAFDELFKNHSESLDLGNLLSSTVMFATDLGRSGHNRQAADFIKTILDATVGHLDSVWAESLELLISRHNALSHYKPYGITFTGSSGHIPFKIVPVGEAKHGSVLMHLEKSSINGNIADITFDTGAGVNMISDSLAKKFNLIPIDGYVTVAGIGQRKGQFAIAKEVKIGNMTVSDVPFVIMDFKTGHAKADNYTDCFNVVIGSELMLQLKDLTIDFINREITIPSEVAERSNATPNICFGQGMSLNVIGAVLNNPLLMCIDTGDASYGTLDASFFEANKDFIKSNAETDTIRRAGIGGVTESLCYRVRNMPVSMGGHTVGVPDLVVDTSQSSAAMNFECNIGLKTLMMFDKIRFNLVDFVLTTDTDNSSVHNKSRYNPPVFKFTKANGPSALQALGIVAIGITRGLINPNAPANPDL
ncbi:retropepsin-like aspartic protease [Duncaniella dubosii]|jgi:hypothetical protein|uniref:retropepsin-like aspartic protease n=1 Tax=Duncaniella dubosii TaxID=2518971 RepID=UPI0025AFC1DD|nr:retropepsin-like aspartic protease [uncultured Duncaniella sp.]